MNERTNTIPFMPAGEELEKMTQARHAKENEITFPHTPEELIAATIGPDGALGDLSITLARISDISQVSEHLLEIQQRLERFLYISKGKGKKKTRTPSAYVRLLTKSLPDGTDLTAIERKAFIEAQSHIAAEINPLLQKLSDALHTHTDTLDAISVKKSLHTLRTKTGLIERLSRGSIEGQQTMSLFGIITTLSSSIEDIQPFDTFKHEHISKLIILDPLSGDSESYWNERMTIQKEIYDKETTLPELIASKSLGVSYECDRASERIGKTITLLNTQLEKSEDVTTRKTLQEKISAVESLQHAYKILSVWVMEESELFQKPMNAENFAFHTRSLHFAQGDPDTITDVLNALETIKQNDAEFYIRMMGIQRGSTSSEATRSDLFGNVLHIALHHSLHLEAGKGTLEAAAFAQRIQGLTEMDTKQLAFSHINEEQWREIDGTLKPYIEQAVKEGSFAKLAPFLTTYATSYADYQLRKMLQTASLEKRAEFLEHLRKASPDEYIHKIKKISKADTDIVNILRERGIIDYLKKEFSRKDDTSAIEFFIYVCKKNPSIERYLLDIKMVLWKTVPPDVLLSNDIFLRYLGVYLKRYEKDGKSHRKFASTIQKTINSTDPPFNPILDSSKLYYLNYLLETLEAHKNITKKQWLDWFKKISKNDLTSQGKKILTKFWNSLSDENINNTKTNFFVLLSFIQRSESGYGLKDYIKIMFKDHNSSWESRLNTPARWTQNFTMTYKIFPTEKFIDVLWKYAPKHLDSFLTFFETLTAQQKKDLLGHLFGEMELLDAMKPFYNPGVDQTYKAYEKIRFDQITQGGNDFGRTIEEVALRRIRKNFEIRIEEHWQIDILNLAEKYIPNHLGYEQAKKHGIPLFTDFLAPPKGIGNIPKPLPRVGELLYHDGKWTIHNNKWDSIRI